MFFPVELCGFCFQFVIPTAPLRSSSRPSPPNTSSEHITASTFHQHTAIIFSPTHIVITFWSRSNLSSLTSNTLSSHGSLTTTCQQLWTQWTPSPRVFCVAGAELAPHRSRFMWLEAKLLRLVTPVVPPLFYCVAAVFRYVSCGNHCYLTTLTTFCQRIVLTPLITDPSPQPYLRPLDDGKILTCGVIRSYN